MTTLWLPAPRIYYSAGATAARTTCKPAPRRAEPPTGIFFISAIAAPPTSLLAFERDPPLNTRRSYRSISIFSFRRFVFYETLVVFDTRALQVF